MSEKTARAARRRAPKPALKPSENGKPPVNDSADFTVEELIILRACLTPTPGIQIRPAEAIGAGEKVVVGHAQAKLERLIPQEEGGPQ